MQRLDGNLSKEVWDELFASLGDALNQEHRSSIQKAWDLRWDAFRKRQDTYILPCEMKDQSLDLLKLLVRIRLDPDAMSAGLLLDQLSPDCLTIEEIEEKMGAKVASLCSQTAEMPSFSLDKRKKKENGKRKAHIIEQTETFRRMLLAMAKDLRVVLLLLIHRLHSLRFLPFSSVDEQPQIARECREIYAPLANRLGISWVKNEFEDLTFRYLYPLDFYGLVKAISTTQVKRNEYIQEVRSILSTLLAKHEVEGMVKGRSKHLNSIFRKMLARQIGFEELYDITAFRIICDTKEECYLLLGLIHDKWKPIPGRFKDYIALPKSNMYQSLHTTVIGPRQKRMEVQIRTDEMDRIAEDGIAAHWLYKEGGQGEKSAGDVHWLRSLLSLQDEKSDEDAFIADVQDHLFDSKVFVFTPNGDVKELRQGSTPIDFAYSIHTHVGKHCVGAKVNGKMVPLRYEFQHGDIVEILTSPSAHPNRGWLDYAKTSRARTKIRAYLRQEQKKDAIEEGKDRLEKELIAAGQKTAKVRKNAELERAAKHLNITNADELLASVGFGRTSPKAVVRFWFPPEPELPPVQDSLDELEPPSSTKPSSGGILVDGFGDSLIRLAKCCNPIPGDPITGFISRGRGVIVHRRTCPRLREVDAERKIKVSWRSDESKLHSVSLRVLTEGRSALFSKISQIFEKQKIHVTRSQSRNFHDEAVLFFRCQISNVQELQTLLRQISEVRGVIEVKRMRH